MDIFNIPLGAQERRSHLVGMDRLGLNGRVNFGRVAHVLRRMNDRLRRIDRGWRHCPPVAKVLDLGDRET